MAKKALKEKEKEQKRQMKQQKLVFKVPEQGGMPVDTSSSGIKMEPAKDEE